VLRARQVLVHVAHLLHRRRQHHQAGPAQNGHRRVRLSLMTTSRECGRVRAHACEIIIIIIIIDDIILRSYYYYYYYYFCILENCNAITSHIVTPKCDIYAGRRTRRV